MQSSSSDPYSVLGVLIMLLCLIGLALLLFGDGLEWLIYKR
jgi:hypothetical protein